MIIPLFKTQSLNFKDILRYPDLSIPQHQMSFVVGASGTGKSTLFKLFNGSLQPTSGAIFYNDTPLEALDPILHRQNCLLCGQSPYLFDKTIKENFDEFFAYRDLPLLEVEAIKNYLSICAADFDLSANCLTLSGGERQRVFIAICLSLKPQTLLLDEPTSALDDEKSHALLFSLKDYCAKNSITPIIISHNKSMIEKYADYCVELSANETKQKEGSAD